MNVNVLLMKKIILKIKNEDFLTHFKKFSLDFLQK